MSALPNTTAAPDMTAPLAPALTRRQENYARCVASGMSYAEAFRQSGCVASTSGSMSRQIGELNRTPKVAARIKELRLKSDKAVESTFADRAAWLRLVVEADPAELTRVVHDPCGLCWTDAEIAAAMLAHFSTPFDPEQPRPPLPDSKRPRHDCPGCRGEGHSRVVLTPTDELSPAGRALFKGASQDEKGVIKIQMHDQAAALDMLNKMHSSYVQRSMNLNVNAAVHAARDISTADAAKLFDAFGDAP